jgi:hypothetical protein
LTGQIRYKFDDIPPEVSSMVEQLNEKRVSVMKKRILEAKTLMELVGSKTDGNELEKINVIRRNPMK